MAGDTVIRVDNLGKKYIIGHEVGRNRHTTLRDVLSRGASTLLRNTMALARGRTVQSGRTTEEFWALKDVSFEVRRGEVLGIVGRNGAGKSTLLKILSRITEPSEGQVEISRRVASLLEVGTGFHPELTGRENVFLNGAILGMTRGEIKRKFDEIIAFAEVEQFLDTPVKRYSTGMYVRLAFAVAAHLDPEILFVDEVLAVGDAEFQKKCLGKMQNVAELGRTVIFVSHNLHAVSSLCTRALVLDRGHLKMDDDVEACLKYYKGISLTRTELSDGRRGIVGAWAHSYPEEYIEIVVRRDVIKSDSGELRVFLRTENGEIIAMASMGGFLSKPLHVPESTENLTIKMDISGLADGTYKCVVQFLESSSYKNIYQEEVEHLEFTSMSRNGEFQKLSLSNSMGYFRMPMRIYSDGQLVSHDA